MPLKIKIAFYSYLIANIMFLSAGAIYLIKDSFMPYHSVAIGLAWSEVPQEFQIVLLALMRAFGGASVAFCFAIAIILFIPFRQQKDWAIWAVPGLLFIQTAGSTYAMLHVATNTGAQPPLWAIAAGLVPFFIGLFCTILEKRRGAS